MAGRLSGIGIAYPRPSRGDDEMVGRRMPDIDCDGKRLYELLREGKFVLVDGRAGARSTGTDIVHAVDTATRSFPTPSWCAPTATWRGPSERPTESPPKLRQRPLERWTVDIA